MNLKSRIKESGWTIVALAKAMNTSQPNLSHLLKDGANPSLKKLQEIADIIGIPLSVLVADEADVPVVTGDGTPAQDADISSLSERLSGIEASIDGLRASMEAITQRLEEVARISDEMHQEMSRHSKNAAHYLERIDSDTALLTGHFGLTPREDASSRHYDKQQ